MVNLARNFKNSISGFKAAFTDRSFRAQLLLGALLIPLVITSSASPILKLCVIGTYLLLLAFELINTAIEALCDLITLEHHPAIKAIKDMASGAVFLVLLILLGEATIALLGLPEL